MSEQLARQLATERAAVDVRNDHRVRSEIQAAELKQRRADARFARERRNAERAGQRAAMRAQLMRSPERKAAALAQINVIATWALIAGLVIFAGKSTTGAQAGLTRMMSLENGSPGWWSAWFVEPALITVVVVIILVKARLREVGVKASKKMNAVEASALAISLALNVYGAGQTADEWALVGYSMGPVGCALIAFLMGVVNAAIIDAISGLPIGTADESTESEPVKAEAYVVTPEPIEVRPIEAPEPQPEVVEEATETVTRTVRRTTRGAGITDEERARVIDLIQTRPELSASAIAAQVWGAGTHPNKIKRDAELAVVWAAVRG